MIGASARCADDEKGLRRRIEDLGLADDAACVLAARDENAPVSERCGGMAAPLDVERNAVDDLRARGKNAKECGAANYDSGNKDPYAKLHGNQVNDRLNYQWRTLRGSKPPNA